MPHQTSLDQFLEFAPGLHLARMNVRFGVRAPRGDVTFRRMIVRKRPMDQVEIEIVKLEVGERFLERRNHVLLIMFVIPQLGGDPDLLA